MVNVAFETASNTVMEGESVEVCVVASGATLERNVVINIGSNGGTATGELSPLVMREWNFRSVPPMLFFFPRRWH